MKFVCILLSVSLWFPGFSSLQAQTAQERVERIERFSNWQRGWLTTLAERHEPWIWALSLHYSTTLLLHSEFAESFRRGTTERLLQHPSLSPEALYWTALFCTRIQGAGEYCPTNEFIERLIAVDAENFYSHAIVFDHEVAARTGIRERGPDDWEWSHFDAWLEQAVSLDRFENYDFIHFAQVVDGLIEHGQFWGIPSFIPNAPLNWQAAIFVMDRLVYPSFGISYSLKEHCRLSTHQGRTRAQMFCRDLAEKLLQNSESIWSRRDALELLSYTYASEDSQSMRKQREAYLWGAQGPIVNCLKGYFRYTHHDWDLNYDLHQFVSDFVTEGQISALQKMADSQNWRVEENDYTDYRCVDIINLPDDDLIRVLGRSAPWLTK